MDPYTGKKRDFRNTIVSNNIDFLQDKLFLEFGVMQGHSIIDFYGAYMSNDINAEFYGFDSFEGLPEEILDKNSPWPTGKFGCGGEVHQNLIGIPEINIVKGWFSDTLTESLLEKFGNKKIGLLHVDCDIYSATIEVLEYVIQNDLLCDGSLIIYDDWGAYRAVGNADPHSVAEGRAHKEIVEKYNLNFELISTKVLDPAYYELATFKYRGRD